MVKKKFGLYCIVIAVIAMTFCLFLGMFGQESAYASWYGKYDSVYVGGIPIGINAKSDYFVVTEIVDVVGENGAFSPALQAGIERGDLIYSVNGKAVGGIADFNGEIQNSEQVTLSVGRGSTVRDIVVQPAYDVTQSAKKIGLLIKNDISGLGTMTFVTKDGQFAALGHMICDGYGYGDIYTDGTIYECEVTGYNNPTENIPGELRGSVDYSAEIGTFSTNNIAGIYGTANIDVSTLSEMEIADREEVTSGKAQILTTLEGDAPQLYDIEIIKAVKQAEIADKSMVIRVTDSRLKSTAGGILQGMSGSPIIQNGKLVGAVTHVFTNDSTKGYGIYAEWMVNNLK